MFSPREKSQGPWKQGQEFSELRRPHATPAVPCLFTPDSGGGGDTAKRSSLSADAKEFFPKSYHANVFENKGFYQNYPAGQFDEGRAFYHLPVVPLWAAPPHLAGRGHPCWNPSVLSPVVKVPVPIPVPEAIPQQFNSVPSTTTPSPQEQFSMKRLQEVMENLTLNPGRFDAVIEPLTTTFSHHQGDAVLVQKVVDAIMEQSVTEPNFRYNGARLCVLLCNASTEVDHHFRNALIDKCQEKSTSVPSLLIADAQQVHNLTLFLAELYIQLGVSNCIDDQIALLGSNLLHTLDVLLNAAQPEQVKCACQVLKLAGQALEKQDGGRMNVLFNQLASASARCPNETSVRHLVDNVVQLRKSMWGSNVAASQSSVGNQQECTQNEPVFYGPDGQILTAEESRFLQDSVGRIQEADECDDSGEDGELWMLDDDLNEDFYAAYEEFLNLSNQAKKT